MDATPDFEDRLAARLLGVPLDADAAAIRGRFRALAMALHPDRSVLDACVDLGRLAEARDRLLARAARRERAAELLRAAERRQRDADQRLESMRPQKVVEVVERVEAAAVARAKVRHPSAGWQPKPSAVTARFEPDTAVGRRIDLAG